MAKGRDNDPGVYRDTMAAGSAEQAVLKKQDEIIALLKSLMAKLDLDAGITDVDYASSLTDALSTVTLK